ncbi:MAG: hypothetical protein R3266_02465 [Gemmatimonadota bacterium]|nr:hypothetical protein [Gemmatimonadota bacterium]
MIPDHARSRPTAATLLALACLGSMAGPLCAQEPTPDERLEALEARVDSLSARLESARPAGAVELQAQLDAVIVELERLRLGEAEVLADSSAFGFAPAASKVYRVRRGVSLGGYGEILYENFAAEREDGEPASASDQIDALRAIIYLGYRFSDRILFNSEIEFEHASTGQAGSASVEFATLDYLLGERFGLRGGLLLVPMGFINEIHEPTTFLGTERPETERAIMPSTWRENGIGVFGETDDLSFRAYVVNGLDGVGEGASGASGFSSSGLRGGRQKGSKAIAEDLAFVGRADWTALPGFMLGGSVYVGESAQNARSALDPDRRVGGLTTIFEGHAQLRRAGFDVRGLYAAAHLDDVEELNAIRGFTGDATIGERLAGGYVQLGYDLLHRTASDHEIVPYIRYERLDTQASVPDGFTADPAQERQVVSVGAAWRPLLGMIVKADYQFRSNEAGTATDQFNIALGYAF